MASILKRYKRSLWFIAFRQLKKNRLAVVSLIVIIVYIILALFVQFGFLSKSYNEKHKSPGEISPGKIVMLFREYEPPSGEFWFGTDIFGRDVFQKAVYGVRTALMIGLITSLIAIPIGLILGAVAGYFGGLTDEIIVWFYSAVASIPGLLLLLSLSLLFGRGLKGVYLAIGLTSWVGLCRLVRGEVLKIKNVEYVQATRALGAGHFRIIFLHIVPNVFHLVIINFTLQFCYAIKAEVILSYLGIGVELGQPSWGNMIQSARQELQRGVWWQFAAATIAMFIIVLAFNLFGDALRDALDPRLKNA